MTNTETNQEILKGSKMYGRNLSETFTVQIGVSGNDYITGTGLLKYAERVTSSHIGGVTTSGGNWAYFPLNGRTIYTYASNDPREQAAFRRAVSKLTGLAQVSYL